MMLSSSPSSAPHPDLIESLGAIIWEGDPVTFQSLYVNRVAEGLLGYSLEDWLARPTFWIDVLHPEDRHAAIAVRRAAVEERRDHDSQYRVIAADGSIRWLRDLVGVSVLQSDCSPLDDVAERDVPALQRAASHPLLLGLSPSGRVYLSVPTFRHVDDTKACDPVALLTPGPDQWLT